MAQTQTVLQATSTTSSPVVAAPPTVQTTGSALVINGYSIDWMVLALIAALAWIVYILYRAQRDPNNIFDIMDLVMENNRLSRMACVMMGAFGITSWMMIQLTINGKITEGIFGLYSAAWIAPTVTKMFVGPPKVESKIELTTSTTEKKS